MTKWHEAEEIAPKSALKLDANPHNPSAPLTKPWPIRLNDYYEQLLEDNAKAENISKSAWLRQAMLEKAKIK